MLLITTLVAISGFVTSIIQRIVDWSNQDNKPYNKSDPSKISLCLEINNKKNVGRNS